VIGALIAFRKYGKPVFKADFSLWRYLFGQAYFLSISSFIAVGMFRIDIFLLPKAWLGGSYSWVALFQVPHSLILQLQIIPFAFGCALFPLMSRFGRDDRDGLLNLYRDAFRLLFLISIPITCLLIFFAPLIIRILCPEVATESVHTLRILSLSVIPLFFHALFSNVLISIKKQKSLVFASVMGFILNVILDILLIPGWGPAGAATGKVGAYLLVSICLYYSVTRELGTLHLLDRTLKPLLAGLAAGVILFAARDYNIYAIGLAGCAAYVLFLFLLRGFTPRDRELIRAILGKGRTPS
jgi:O-antigen/teichoic acid export membrane protein